jgi:hypothetical protein
MTVARIQKSGGWAGRYAGLSAIRKPKIFSPMVEDNHPLELRLPDLAQTPRNTMRANGLVLIKETIMAQSNRDPSTAETGERVPTRPHDSGSQANETVDGLDAATEALRHAAEDTPSGTGPGDIEKTPVFDRAGVAPKI